MSGTIRVRSTVLARLLEEARKTPDQECCGLLGGAADVVTEIFPARNTLASATAYEIAPEDLFRLFRAMRVARLEHLGIYHSHPTGGNSPSPRDVELAFYPDTAYFIVSPQPGTPKPVRAFTIRDGNVSELAIKPV